jgi:hypothetical protein
MDFETIQTASMWVVNLIVAAICGGTVHFIMIYPLWKRKRKES